MNDFFETLCNNHNQNIFELKQLKKKLKQKGYTEVVTDIDLLIERTRFCKVQGQHMENRMRKYKYAIESLGFKRIIKDEG